MPGYQFGKMSLRLKKKKYLVSGFGNFNRADFQQGMESVSYMYM